MSLTITCTMETLFWEPKKNRFFALNEYVSIEIRA